MGGEADKGVHNRGSITGGIILLGLGLFFLALQWDWIPYGRESWPLILIILGIALLAGSLFSRRKRQR